MIETTCDLPENKQKLERIKMFEFVENNKEKENTLISEQELSSWMGVSLTTIRLMRYKGLSPAYIPIGSGKRTKIAYLIKDVLSWMDKRKVSPENGREESSSSSQSLSEEKQNEIA